MAQASGEEKKPPTRDVDIDPDFEPQKRPRSCTWPLPRPECGTGKPEASEADIIPEEEDDESGPDRRVDDTDTHTGEQSSYTRAKQSHNSGPPGPTLNTTCNDKDSDGSPSPSASQALAAAATDSGITTLSLQQPRKSSARRNAWGNYSYADLITQAIESSPEKRLTLAQIYDWMVRSVPYFKDKGDSNSSAGWKVSGLHIRT